MSQHSLLPVRSDDELLPLSALQHVVFCERRCALIHLEQTWQDNALTVEGSHRHLAVDETAPRRELREGVVTLRGEWLRSSRLGVTGRADVVEIRGPGVAEALRPGPGGWRLRGPGEWSVRPVEYKRGRPMAGRADEVQLCAQAICLEEMLGLPVERGDLYYGRTRRRRVVPIDAELRRITDAAASRLHEILATGRTPRPRPGTWCRNCSLAEACMPAALAEPRSVRAYLRAAIAPLGATGQPEGDR